MNEAPLTRAPWQNPVAGWFAACIVATVVASLFFWSVLENPDIVFLLFGFVLAFSLIPSLLTVLVCEKYSIRNLVWYVLAGIISAVGIGGLAFGIHDILMGLLFASVGGSMALTYWFVSGRYSGLRFHRGSAST